MSKKIFLAGPVILFKLIFLTWSLAAMIYFVNFNPTTFHFWIINPGLALLSTQILGENNNSTITATGWIMYLFSSKMLEHQTEEHNYCEPVRPPACSTVDHEELVFSPLPLNHVEVDLGRGEGANMTGVQPGIWASHWRDLKHPGVL